MEWPEFLRYEGRLFGKAIRQTWATTNQHLVAIYFTIGIPIAVALFAYFVPAFDTVFSGGGLMQEWIVALAGIILFLVFFLSVFTKNLILAPSTEERELQNNLIEKGDRIKVLEDANIPKFDVRPRTDKRTSYEQTELTSWAELEIRNTSPSVDLADVNVKIVELVRVYEKQNEKGIGIGEYHLHEPYPNWSPANVYWSGRTGTPHQFSRPINPGELQYATIAFHHKNGAGLGVFNNLNHTPLLECRIVVELSSSGSNSWQGIYYVAYHPLRTDEFEFVEWHTWCESHKVVEKSNPDKEGYRP